MKKVVITGASSGIGKTIALRLLNLDYEVIGVSRYINGNTFSSKNFSFIKTDLSNEKDTLELCEKLKKIDIYILINCAGFGKFEPHEELSYKTIMDMTFLNLTSAMLLSSASLRSLKRNDGYLININSIEALRASKFAAVYSATKAGLKAFGDCIFEENRKTKLSVTNINPDMTETNFYKNLRFDVSSKEDEKLLASDIAEAVEHILKIRKGAVISEYTIRSTSFGILKKKL
ncbi:MAG: short-chain dehydrogenase [Sulfurimonas sp.]|nr:MAG: short-chain dehydrogenase [Sulfurimonas sp.]